MFCDWSNSYYDKSTCILSVWFRLKLLSYLAFFYRLVELTVHIWYYFVKKKWTRCWQTELVLPLMVCFSLLSFSCFQIRNWFTHSITDKHENFCTSKSIEPLLQNELQNGKPCTHSLSKIPNNTHDCVLSIHVRRPNGQHFTTGRGEKWQIRFWNSEPKIDSRLKCWAAKMALMTWPAKGLVVKILFACRRFLALHPLWELCSFSTFVEWTFEAGLEWDEGQVF